MFFGKSVIILVNPKLIQVLMKNKEITLDNLNPEEKVAVNKVINHMFTLYQIAKTKMTFNVWLDNLSCTIKDFALKK
jgi:hypothetical protein